MTLHSMTYPLSLHRCSDIIVFIYLFIYLFKSDMKYRGP